MEKLHMERLIETHKRMIEMAAKDLVVRAGRLGIILTVTQGPESPLVTQVQVSEARAVVK